MFLTDFPYPIFLRTKYTLKHSRVRRIPARRHGRRFAVLRAIRLAVFQRRQLSLRASFGESSEGQRIRPHAELGQGERRVRQA